MNLPLLFWWEGCRWIAGSDPKNLATLMTQPQTYSNPQPLEHSRQASTMRRSFWSG